MPKSLRRLPGVESPFVLRAELLTLVPHSMSTIDRLEAESKFPGRIRLEPTNRVAWLRREVRGYLRHLAKGRQAAAPEDQVKGGGEESPDRDASSVKAKRADPG